MRADYSSELRRRREGLYGRAASTVRVIEGIEDTGVQVEVIRDRSQISEAAHVESSRTAKWFIAFDHHVLMDVQMM